MLIYVLHIQSKYTLFSSTKWEMYLCLSLQSKIGGRETTQMQYSTIIQWIGGIIIIVIALLESYWECLNGHTYALVFVIVHKLIDLYHFHLCSKLMQTSRDH